jgi:Tol biopolymer transport system component
LATVDGGTVTALMWTPQQANHPSWTSNEKRIAFEGYMDGPLYDLEMAMPMLRPMGDDQRFDFEMPCWDPSGKNVVYARSSLEDNFNHDIMLSRVIDLPVGYYASAKNSWLARMPGNDIFPVFSPDGKNVVFAHELSNPANTDYLKIRYALYIVSSDQAVGDKNYIPPHLIAGDIPTPTRISWFPDGQKVLLSYQNGDWYDKTQNNIYPPEIVDIKNGKRISLGWPMLHDPDFPQGFPLVPEELAVNPAGDRVAFCAMRWSGDPKDKGARVIYSCKIDGTDLRRETPYDLKESEMVIYQYPKAGVNARNAFDKLLVEKPKPLHN